MRFHAFLSRALAVLTTVLLISNLPLSAGIQFENPPGGWDYIYTGDAADPTAGAALDGSWNYTNGSSTWSGDPPNEPGNADGGVGSYPVVGEPGNNALLIVDSKTADPNRKIAILRDLGPVVAGDPFLDDGFTLSLRVRLPSSVADLPTAPDGYVFHDGNKGMFIIRQTGGTLSFTLGMANRDSAFNTPTTGNGAMVADGTGFKFIPLDPIVWNELWVTAVQNVDDPARYDVKIWKNGATTAPIFADTVALATGTEGTFPTYMAMQLGATPQVGAVEVDFFAVKDGLYEPPAPPPDDLLSLFQVAPSIITSGQSATLQWTVAPGATVTITPGLGDVTAQTNASGNGSIAVSPAKTTTYTITSTKNAQSEQGTVAVTVRMVESFTSTPGYFAPGGQVALAWKVRAGATVTIAPGLGDVTAQTNPATGVGSVNASPSGSSATYTLVASEGTESGQSALTVVRRTPSTQVYADPAGGWGCTYDGAALPTDVGWSATNGSSTFSGSVPGSGGTTPGGAGVFTEGGDTFLRIQDTGDPTDYGMPDPSNRKIYFTYAITNCLPKDYAPLTTGVTLHLRTRVPTTGPLDQIHPDGGGGPSDYPADGDGYVIFAGGKGNFGLRQEGLPAASNGIVSLSLSTELSAGGGDTTANVVGLVMNALNGSTTTGAVNTGDGTANQIEFDPTAWHEIWLTLVADDSGGGTHRLDFWLDGAASPVTHHVTAGDGSETVSEPYLAMGCGATVNSGAVDVDYFNVKAGLLTPQVLAPVAPFLITAVSRDPVTGEVTLTWNSQAGVSYAVQASTTLASWPETVASGIVAAGPLTTRTIPAAQAGTGTKYFRVTR